MPLPTNNARPSIPYTPTQILPNNDRYGSLGQFPPTAAQLDGDLNALVDFINTLADAVNNVAAGILPGADDPLNVNKIPVTDGDNNISWTLIQAIHMAANAIQTNHIQNAAITPDKIQPQAVTADKLSPNAVTSSKIDEEAIESEHFSYGCIPYTAYQNNSIAGTRLFDKTVPGSKIQDEAISNDKLGAVSVTYDKLGGDVEFKLVPTGTILPYARATLPGGVSDEYLLCDGSAVLRSTYSSLFAIIGTTYGSGDGSTTFNVPDLRGRMPVGFVGSANGLITLNTADKLALGGQGGAEQITLNSSQIPAHTHNVNVPWGYGDNTSFLPPIHGGFNGENTYTTDGGTGGGQPHNNMPPFLFLNFIIKT